LRSSTDCSAAGKTRYLFDMMPFSIKNKGHIGNLYVALL
jgi:hypothetical protein